MKKRVFQRLVDSTFEVVIITEDWSCGDRELMVQFGEPEVNVGGDVYYVNEDVSSSSGDDAVKVVNLPDELVRIMNGFPYSRIFDARDYESYEEARAVAAAWKEKVLGNIDEAVIRLRNMHVNFDTEEVSEI
jgi:hypothetical protein